MGVKVELSTRQELYVAGDVVHGSVNLTVDAVSTHVTGTQIRRAFIYMYNIITTTLVLLQLYTFYVVGKTTMYCCVITWHGN